MTELELQAQVADYIRLQYPSVLFHSDFGSGIKLTMGQAIKQKRLNGGRRSWPDMFLAEPDIGKTDGSKRAIREQYDMLHDLRARGYAAEFACGFDEAKKLIDDYMKGRYAHVD